MKIIRNSLAIVGLLGLVGLTQAANPPTNSSPTMVPEYVNYQGRLMTPANVPYSNTTHKILVKLWSAAAGGINMWTEFYNVQTRDGYFSVNLGSGGTNTVPLWKVLWNYDGNETNNVYMALTLLSGPDGNDVPAIESTPRQQFLTTPFAFRAHQSEYARKADGITAFEAPAGVQTPSITSTNAQLLLNAGSEVKLNSDLRLPSGGDIYASTIQPAVTSLSVGTDGATTVYVGTSPGSSDAGSTTRLQGRYLALNSTNICFHDVNNIRHPLMVRKQLLDYAITQGSGTSYTIPQSAHGIYRTLYDVAVVGWHTTITSRFVTGIYADENGDIHVTFSGVPTEQLMMIDLYLMGTAKGLSN